jgi:hypothetical protein
MGRENIEDLIRAFVWCEFRMSGGEIDKIIFKLAKYISSKVR